MRGACAITLDNDRTFISFGVSKRGTLSFLREVEVPPGRRDTDPFIFLQANSEILNKKIKEVEESDSLRVERVFLELPKEFESRRIVSEVVPLKRRKKIALRDIPYVRKHLEGKFLDWDDFCVHNIMIGYGVDGKNYASLPLGIWTKKIQAQSMLVYTKDKIYRKALDIFDNMDRNFGGFVSGQISMYACAFDLSGQKYLSGSIKEEPPQVVVNFGYNTSCFAVRNKNDFILSPSFDFGLKKIIDELSKRFLLNPPLAQEVFQRYISFKEIPYFKEVTIKKGGGYINLSVQAASFFIKDYVRREFSSLLQRVREDVGGDEFVISFIGRLNVKEGFYGFLKNYFSCNLKSPIQNPSLSSSSGCLRYGVSGFLEKNHKRNRSFLQNILEVYREYF